MFTWGLFLLIVSGGDEEKMKAAKSRLIYGTLGLIFMGFVRFWGMIIALGEFDGGIQSTANTFFSLALYFAGPIAIFFLMFGGYYYITSG
jgi:small-conductance mechanosensitive channel